MSNRGGDSPHTKLHCPKCKWKTARTYNEGFGNCIKCGTKMVKTLPTNRHIVSKK